MTKRPSYRDILIGRHRSANNKGNEEVQTLKNESRHDDTIIVSQISNININWNNSTCNWLDLPDTLLVSIFHLISTSIIDILAFSAVCTHWRFLAKSSPNQHRTFPPVLFSAIYNRPKWSRSLKTLTHNSRPIKPLISERCIDVLASFIHHSHGHLILSWPTTSRSHRSLIIADVFTRNVIISPEFLAPSTYVSYVCILTAPPSSPSCMLLLGGDVRNLMGAADIVDDNVVSYIRCWHLGVKDNSWSLLKLKSFHGIRSLLLFDGKLFCLFRSLELLVFESLPPTSWKELKVLFPKRIGPECYTYSENLVECNGDLLLVLFIQGVHFASSSSLASSITIPWGLTKIEVYRLDFENHVWVEVDNLGDWSLFKDCGSGNLFACPNPTRWGGRSNCVYVAHCGFDFWSVVPLDGNPFKSKFESCCHPSSLWVYPSMF